MGAYACLVLPVRLLLMMLNYGLWLAAIRRSLLREEN